MSMEETPDSAGVVLNDELAFDSVVIQRLIAEVRTGEPTRRRGAAMTASITATTGSKLGPRAAVH